MLPNSSSMLLFILYVYVSIYIYTYVSVYIYIYIHNYRQYIDVSTHTVLCCLQMLFTTLHFGHLKNCLLQALCRRPRRKPRRSMGSTHPTMARPTYPWRRGASGRPTRRRSSICLMPSSTEVDQICEGHDPSACFGEGKGDI